MAERLLYLVDGELTWASVGELRRLPHERLGRLREPGRFQGQINRGGLHYSTLTNTHEPFESLLEWRWLKTLEFDVTVASVRTQCLYIDGGIDHYPDLLLRTHDGRTVLADVRAAELMDEDADAKFSATRDLCARVGIEYVVLDDTDADLLALSDHYTRCRHPDRCPTGLLDAVRDAVDATPGSLADVVQRTRAPFPDQAVAAVRHLIWRGELHAERLGEWPLGISDRGHLWCDDLRRNLALRDHRWTGQRKYVPEPRPANGSEDGITHTLPWPADAANTSAYDRAEIRRVEAAFDALACYAAVTDPVKYPSLTQWARLLDRANPMEGLGRKESARLLSGILESHGFGATRQNRSVLLTKCEHARSSLVLVHGNRERAHVEDTHTDWLAVAVDHLRRTADGPQRLDSSRIFEIDEEFAQIFPALSVPSRDAKAELLRSAELRTRTRGRRGTVRSNLSVPDVYGYWHEVVPGHLQMDTTNFAVRLLSPTVPGAREGREISILFDTASRQPVAVSLHKVGTSSDVVLDLLLQTCRRPDTDTRLAHIGKPLSVALPADWPDDQPTVGLAGQPHPTVIALEKDPDTGEPSLVVQRALSQIAADVVTIDGGAAENSRRTLAAMLSLGITVVFANKRTGHHKPHVERWFGTVKSMISDHLGGFTGGSVDRRGRQPDIDANVTPDELERHLLSWLHDEWRNRTVTFHNRFGRPTIKLSPNQYVELSRKLHGWSAPTVELQHVIAAMHKVERKITRGTVQNGREYFHPRLVDIQGRAASRHKRDNSKVTLAYPHAHSDYVYVLLPTSPPEWLYVPARTPDPATAEAPAACELYALISELDATAIAKSQQEVWAATRRRSRGRVGQDLGLEELAREPVKEKTTPDPALVDDDLPPSPTTPALPGPAPLLQPSGIAADPVDWL